MSNAFTRAVSEPLSLPPPAAAAAAAHAAQPPALPFDAALAHGYSLGSSAGPHMRPMTPVDLVRAARLGAGAADVDLAHLLDDPDAQPQARPAAGGGAVARGGVGGEGAVTRCARGARRDAACCTRRRTASAVVCFAWLRQTPPVRLVLACLVSAFRNCL